MAAEVERFGPFVCGAKGQSASSAAARLSSAFRGLRTHSVTAAAAGGEGCKRRTPLLARELALHQSCLRL